MSANDIVKFKLNTANPKPLTNEQRKRLQEISVLPDAQIDYSDMPGSTTKLQWASLQRYMNMSVPTKAIAVCE
jgi:hypothetical protein